MNTLISLLITVVLFTIFFVIFKKIRLKKFAKQKESYYCIKEIIPDTLNEEYTYAILDVSVHRAEIFVLASLLFSDKIICFKAHQWYVNGVFESRPEKFGHYSIKVTGTGKVIFKKINV